MSESLRQRGYEVAHQVRSVYWRVAKPKTFGVKAFILSPDESQFVLIRHSYGETDVAALPGGGYKPKRETPIEAALREADEELAVTLIRPYILGETTSQFEGKRDTITLIGGVATSRSLVPDPAEIADAFWVDLEPKALEGIQGPVSRFAVMALNHHFELHQ